MKILLTVYMYKFVNLIFKTRASQDCTLHHLHSWDGSDSPAAPAMWAKCGGCGHACYCLALCSVQNLPDFRLHTTPVNALNKKDLFGKTQYSCQAIYVAVVIVALPVNESC